MSNRHSNKEPSGHYNMTIIQSQGYVCTMHQSDNPTEDFEHGDTILMHRPTVEKCLKKR